MGRARPPVVASGSGSLCGDGAAVGRVRWADRYAVRLHCASSRSVLWLDRRVRGRGLAVEALGLVTEWAFRDFGIVRVQLVTHLDNERSQRVAERCGFRREGVLRAWEPVKDEQPDVVMWSRLVNDPAPNPISVQRHVRRKARHIPFPGPERRGIHDRQHEAAHGRRRRLLPCIAWGRCDGVLSGDRRRASAVVRMSCHTSWSSPPPADACPRTRMILAAHFDSLGG